MKRSSYLRRIRKRLNDAFDDTELTAFCHDCFLPVYDKFARGMQKNEKISLLLTHCRRPPTRVQALLDAIQEEVEIYPYRRDALSPLIESLEAYLKHLTSTKGKPSTQKAPPVTFSPLVLVPELAEEEPPKEELAEERPVSLSQKPLGIGSERICAKDGMVQIYVPAGKFLMGSRSNDSDAYDDEKPQHEVYLDAYWIDKTPITNAMFAKFVAETGYVTEAEKEGYAWAWIGSEWKKINGAQWRHPRGPKKLFDLVGGSDLRGKDNHPVVCVSWNDAVAYAKWAGRRLPTEAEWEKAAGGTDGRKWPWGNENPTDKLCNFGMNVGDTTPVGKYSDGTIPRRCLGHGRQRLGMVQ